MKRRVPRDEIREWIVTYYNEHGTRPTQDQIATKFGLHNSYLSKVITELDASEPLPGEPLGGPPHQDRDAQMDDVLSYIEGYMQVHTWAPSRREISKGCGITLSTVNHLIALLAARGVIEVGTQSRQIRFPSWTQ